MAAGRHSSPSSTQATFLHVSAAVYSVPFVHHTSCFGHVDCLAVLHFICWSFWSCLVYQSCRSPEATIGPRKDALLNFNGSQSRESMEAMSDFSWRDPSVTKNLVAPLIFGISICAIGCYSMTILP